MINFEDGNLTLKGDPASLLTEVTLIIKALKHEMEKQGMPEEEAFNILRDAYMLGVAKPEHLLEIMRTHIPGEVIKWDEILN